MVKEGNKEKIEREAYVRGKFRVETEIPFTLENFKILHEEATKLAEENDSLKTKVSSLTSTNFDLLSKLTHLETSHEHL
jgi:hypothetical protein